MKFSRSTDEEEAGDHMIVTVTLNPAVDKTYTTARLIPGQANQMNSGVNIPGGKGINVTKVLKQYGYEVAALGFLGGYQGGFIDDYVRSIGAETYFTRMSQETRSTINIIAEDGYVTEIYEPGPQVDIQELSNFFDTYDEVISRCDAVVLSGSAPRGVPADIYARLIQRAKDLGKRVLLDTSKDFLMEGLKAKPELIKPNQKELEYLVGHKIKGIEEAAQAAANLHEQGVPNVMVSMGPKGILYACDSGLYYAKAPTVKIVNTVACGDSVVASFAMSMLQKHSPEETLRQAVAISAANATTIESAVIPMEKAEELYHTITVERL